MAWDVAKFLKDKYLKCLEEIESKKPPSGIPGEFLAIQRYLEDERILSLVDHDYSLISCLHELNDVLREWRLSAEQRHDMMKRIFSYSLLSSPTKATLSRLKPYFEHLHSSLQHSANSPNIRTIFPSNPDRSTSFIESHSSTVVGFHEPANNIDDWLSASGKGSKIVGIHGMGGSGKTTLVNRVLLQLQLRNKNNSSSGSDEPNPKILWACLSDLTSKDEIDIKILQHLLDCLDFDIDSDSSPGYGDDEKWLKEQLKIKLQACTSYVLVFDDVWFWNDWFVDLCRELAEPNQEGGAVVVTSRIKEVATKLVGGEHKLIHLTPLNDTNVDERQFLKAMVQQNVRNDEIVDVDDIVRHCYGLPQAAITLPNILEAKSKLE